MGRKTQRIDTGGGDSLSADNPFAALSGEGLRPAPAAPPPRPAEAKKKETLLLRRLKAGKGGKVVTEVSGFNAAPQQVQELLKRLQSRLATGGTCKGRAIELQGECRDRLKPLLEAEGYGVKGA
jgi:translation initiation factor 1